LIALDSSALVAIMKGEAEAEAFLEVIAAAGSRIMSAVNFLETSLVLAGPAGKEAVWKPLDDFANRAQIAVVAFDAGQSELARAAFLKYGKGRHSAALNFGDCAAYALAKSRAVPLLFKGRDFEKTDIASALA
jgi:ribonuclease VapC